MVVFVAILTTLVIGIPVALVFDRGVHGPLLPGLAFLYGSGVVYFSMLAVSVAGLRWTAVNVTAVALAVAVACFLVPSRVRTTSGAPKAHLPDLLTLWIATGFALFATVAPVWLWDFWAIWGLKSRVFLENGGIDWRFLESPWNAFAHPDYPLLASLNYAYAALLGGGGWSDRWIGLYSVAFGVALLLIVRHMAARELKALEASVVTLAVSGFAMTGFIGLAEAPLTAFATASLLVLRRALIFDDEGAMTQGAILLGLAACTKNEGVSLAVAVVIAVALYARRRLIALWPAALIAMPWMSLRLLHRLSTDVVGGGWMDRAMQRLPRAGEVFATLWRHLVDRPIWALLALALVFIAAGARNLIGRERFVLTVIAIQVMFFVGVYFGSPWKDLDMHIAFSWARLTRQLGAPVVCFVMIMLAHMFEAKDDLAHAEARPEQ